MESTKTQSRDELYRWADSLPGQRDQAYEWADSIPYEPPSKLSTFGRSVGKGFVEGVASVADAFGIATRPIREAVNSGDAEMGIPTQPFDEQGTGNLIRKAAPNVTAEEQGSFTGKLGQALGSAGSFVAGGVAGRAAKLGAVPVLVTQGMAVSAASGYYDAIGNGADEETAWKSFVLNAPMGATEAIPLAGIAGRLAKSLARANTATGGALTKGLLAAGKTVAKEAGQEFVQEAGQTAWSDAVAQGLLDYADDKPFLENVAQAAEAGAFGALSGGILSGASVAIERAGGRARDDASTMPPTQLEGVPPTQGAQNGAHAIEPSAAVDANVARVEPQRKQLTEEDLDPAIHKELSDAFPGARFLAPDPEADAQIVGLTEQRGLTAVYAEGMPDGVEAAYLPSGAVALNPKVTVEERLAAVLDHELAHHAAEKMPGAVDAFETVLERVRPQLLDIALEAYVSDRAGASARALGRDLSESELEAIQGSVTADEAYARLAEDFSPIVRALRKDPDALARVRDVGFWKRILQAARNLIRRVRGVSNRPTAQEQAAIDWLNALNPGKTAENLTPDEATQIAHAVKDLLDSTIGLPKPERTAPAATTETTETTEASTVPEPTGLARPVEDSGAGQQDAQRAARARELLAMPVEQRETMLQARLEAEDVAARSQFPDRGDAWYAALAEKRRQARDATNPEGDKAAIELRRLGAEPLAADPYSTEEIVEALRTDPVAREAHKKTKGPGSKKHAAAEAVKAKASETIGTGPRYAVQQLGANNTLPDETLRQVFGRKVLDYFGRARQAEDATTGGKSTDLSDAETLFRGKVAGAIAEQIEPIERRIREVLRRSGISVDDAGRFLIARHAPKRNEVINKRRPVKFKKAGKAGSGMTDADAAQVIADAQASGKFNDYEQIARLTRTAINKRLDVLERSGLLSSKDRKAWEDTFGPDYVPLKTALDPENTAGGRPTGSFNVTGSESKRAEGRTTEAFNPIVQVFADLRESVVRAEKNAVMGELAKLVRANPHSAIWQEYSSINKVPPADVEAGHVVRFKEGGEEQILVLRADGLAEAVKGLNVEAAGSLLRGMQQVARTYAKLLTSWSPDFFLSNIVRDAQTAGIVLSVEQKNKLRSVLSIPKAMHGAFKALRDPHAQGTWQDAYREMRQAGGATGFYDVKSLQDRLDDFKFDGSKFREGLRSIGKLVEDLNAAAEASTRLAAYKAMRDAGATPRKSALVSKQITINFDRKGELSPAIGAAVLFFNANVQGTARTAKLIATNHKAQAVAGGLVVLGYALAALNDMTDPDDWANRTEFDKQRNLIIEPLNIKFPSPWGFNVFLYAGQQLHAVTHGADRDKAVGDMASSLIQAANPLGGRTFTQALTPWFLRPFQDVDENENFAGVPINPQENPYDKVDRPDSSQSFERTSEVSKMVATFLNDVTGGDEWQKGAIDIGPGSIDYIAQQATGSIGATIGRVVDLATKGPDLARDVPILRVVVSEPSPNRAVSRMYDRIREIESEEKQRQEGNPNADRSIARLHSAAERFKKKAKALRAAGRDDEIQALAEQFNSSYGANK